MIDFVCAQCGKGCSRCLPVRRNVQFAPPFFCSLPCAWAYYAARGDERSFVLLMVWAGRRGNLARVAAASTWHGPVEGVEYRVCSRFDGQEFLNEWGEAIKATLVLKVSPLRFIIREVPAIDGESLLIEDELVGWDSLTRTWRV